MTRGTRTSLAQPTEEELATETVARFNAGRCSRCGQPIVTGQHLARTTQGWAHRGCT